MTVLRIFESIKLEVEFDFSSITNPFSGNREKYEEFKKDFIIFLNL
jgi:hypothetical protein